MTGGLATIRLLSEPGTFDTIAEQTAAIADGMRGLADKHDVPMQIGNLGSMMGFYFLRETGAVVDDYAAVKTHVHTERYASSSTRCLNGVFTLHQVRLRRDL